MRKVTYPPSMTADEYLARAEQLEAEDRLERAAVVSLMAIAAAIRDKKSGGTGGPPRRLPS